MMPFNLLLPPRLYEKLQEFAIAEHKSKGEIIREALEMFFKTHIEPKVVNKPPQWWPKVERCFALMKRGMHADVPFDRIYIDSEVLDMDFKNWREARKFFGIACKLVSENGLECSFEVDRKSLPIPNSKRTELVFSGIQVLFREAIKQPELIVAIERVTEKIKGGIIENRN